MTVPENRVLFTDEGLRAAKRLSPCFEISRALTDRSLEPNHNGKSCSVRASLRRGGRPSLLRKEVIQPQVPLRLPCYDFTPVTNHSLGTCLPCGLAQPLLEQSTSMV